MTPNEHANAHKAPRPDEVARVSCVRHTYLDGTQVDICGLDFVAERGSRIAILGPNGSGKSTLLFHLLGLLKPQEGLVRVFGRDPVESWREIRHRIGIVLQNVDEQLIAPTVADDVAFSARQHGLAEPDVATRVERALGMLGIEHLADRVPHYLSGGEKRKVALAGAIVLEPELLILDEALEGLDPEARFGLIGLINRLAADDDVTVIMTTHDIDSVPDFADHAYVLATGGKIVFDGTPDEMFDAADTLSESNIRPPILAELFARLREHDADAPNTPRSVTEAARVLADWRRS